MLEHCNSGDCTAKRAEHVPSPPHPSCSLPFPPFSPKHCPCGCTSLSLFPPSAHPSPAPSTSPRLLLRPSCAAQSMSSACLYATMVLTLCTWGDEGAIQARAARCNGCTRPCYPAHQQHPALPQSAAPPPNTHTAVYSGCEPPPIHTTQCVAMQPPAVAGRGFVHRTFVLKARSVTTSAPSMLRASLSSLQAGRRAAHRAVVPGLCWIACSAKRVAGMAPAPAHDIDATTAALPCPVGHTWSPSPCPALHCSPAFATRLLLPSLRAFTPGVVLTTPLAPRLCCLCTPGCQLSLRSHTRITHGWLGACCGRMAVRLELACKAQLQAGPQVDASAGQAAHEPRLAGEGQANKSARCSVPFGGQHTACCRRRPQPLPRLRPARRSHRFSRSGRKETLAQTWRARHARGKAEAGKRRGPASIWAARCESSAQGARLPLRLHAVCSVACGWAHTCSLHACLPNLPCVTWRRIPAISLLISLSAFSGAGLQASACRRNAWQGGLNFEALARTAPKGARLYATNTGGGTCYTATHPMAHHKFKPVRKLRSAGADS